MLAIVAALFFSGAVILDLAGGGSGHFTPAILMYIGLVLLALSVAFPGWPRRPPA